MPGTDNPLVLEVIDRYLQRLAIIHKATQMLDCPERVGVARRLTVTDEQRERLNMVTEVVATTFDVPVSTVTVVDDFQARVLGEFGLSAGIPSVSDNAVTRDRSLCTFVAASGNEFDLGTLGPNDLECLPAYMEMDVRAYLGTPVLLKEITVGSLCLVDFVPRTWTDADKILLASYANHVSTILEEKKNE